MPSQTQRTSTQRRSRSTPRQDETPLQQTSGVGTKNIVSRGSLNSVFASAIKDDRLSVVRETGRVTLDDIKGVTPTTLKYLSSIGVWTPEEAYELYKNGNKAELRGLTRKKNFTGKTDGVETLSNIIFTARNIDPTLSKAAIENELRSTTGKNFEKSRKKEIEKYFKFLGVGKGQIQNVTFETRGAGVTVNFVDQLRSNTSSSSSPKKIYGKTRQVMDVSEADRKYVLDRAIRYSMEGFKKSDLKSTKNYDVNDLKAQYDDMIDNELIVDDEWNVIRPNDEIMAKKAFGTEAVLVGSTANPKMAEEGIISPVRPQGYRGLIFQSEQSYNESIRVNGSMVVKSKKDLDNLVEILGYNPKNGFAPNGYAYTDQTVAESPIFNVFIRPPESQSNVINNPESIDIQPDGSNNGFGIRLRSTFDPYLSSTLWIADVDKLIAEGKGYTNARKDFVNEALKDLPESIQKKSIDELPNQYFRKVMTNGMKFGGTLCNTNKKGLSKTSQNEKNLLTELDNLLEINNKYITKRSSSDTTKDVLQAIDVARNQLKNRVEERERNGERDRIKKGLYSRSSPQCQAVDIIPWQGGHSMVFIDPNTQVAKKLEKVRDFCVNERDSSRPDVCMAKLVKVTQNLSNKYSGAGTPFGTALNKMIDRKKDWEFIQDVGEIAREIRTGDAVKTGSKFMRSSKKMEIMTKAGIRNKTPLTVNPWEFIDNMDGKKLTTFAKRT